MTAAAAVEDVERIAVSEAGRVTEESPLIPGGNKNPATGPTQGASGSEDGEVVSTTQSAAAIICLLLIGMYSFSCQLSWA